MVHINLVNPEWEALLGTCCLMKYPHCNFQATTQKQRMCFVNVDYDIKLIKVFIKAEVKVNDQVADGV